jgi:hypothetical protein
MAMNGKKKLMCLSRKQSVKIYTELVHDKVHWLVFMMTEMNFQAPNMMFLDQIN